MVPLFSWGDTAIPVHWSSFFHTMELTQAGGWRMGN